MEEPWESVDNPLLRQTQAAPLVLIPALLVSLLALFFAIRQVVQPLRALESKSAKVGEGDFEALETPVGGIREIKSLQRTMAQMARRLHGYRESVRRYAGAVIHSQEDERRRVARELHDDTIQALIALDQQTQMAQMAVRRGSPDAAEHLTELRGLTQGLLKGVRRVIAALRPIYLEDLGLPAALQMLAQDAGSAAGLEVEVVSSGEPRRLAPEQEIAVYRIAQEALSNVVRHAQGGRPGWRRPSSRTASAWSCRMTVSASSRLARRPRLGASLWADGMQESRARQWKTDRRLDAAGNANLEIPL
jgi:two-component system sensor histidine kinase UhpB